MLQQGRAITVFAVPYWMLMRIVRLVEGLRGQASAIPHITRRLGGCRVHWVNLACALQRAVLLDEAVTLPSTLIIFANGLPTAMDWALVLPNHSFHTGQTTCGSHVALVLAKIYVLCLGVYSCTCSAGNFIILPYYFYQYWILGKETWALFSDKRNMPHSRIQKQVDSESHRKLFFILTFVEESVTESVKIPGCFSLLILRKTLPENSAVFENVLFYW